MVNCETKISLLLALKIKRCDSFIAALEENVTGLSLDEETTRYAVYLMERERNYLKMQLAVVKPNEIANLHRYAPNLLPMSSRIEELQSIRAAMTFENRKLRTDTNRYRSRIKDLQQRIDMEKWDIKRTNDLINANTEKFIEAGKEIQKLTNGTKG